MSVGLVAPIAPAPTASTAAAPPVSAVAPEQQGAAAVGFTPQRMVMWLGALALLWLVLSALADSGEVALARGFALLLLGGAILGLAPRAIENAKTMFSPPPVG